MSDGGHPDPFEVAHYRSQEIVDESPEHIPNECLEALEFDLTMLDDRGIDP